MGKAGNTETSTNQTDDTQTPQCAKDWESPAPRRVRGQLVEGRSLSLSWSLSDVGSHH